MQLNCKLYSVLQTIRFSDPLQKNVSSNTVGGATRGVPSFSTRMFARGSPGSLSRVSMVFRSLLLKIKGGIHNESFSGLPIRFLNMLVLRLANSSRWSYHLTVMRNFAWQLKLTSKNSLNMKMSNEMKISSGWFPEKIIGRLKKESIERLFDPCS